VTVFPAYDLSFKSTRVYQHQGADEPEEGQTTGEHQGPEKDDPFNDEPVLIPLENGGCEEAAIE
jgi:hypothetical protein